MVLNRDAVIAVVAIEQAVVAAKTADHRRPEHAVATVDPIDIPLPPGAIERADREPRPALGRKVDLVDIDEAIEILAVNVVAGELVPFRIGGPAFLQSSLYRGPVTEMIIEIVDVAGRRLRRG